MNLTDIRPQHSSFYLRLLDKTLVMNPITLRDEIKFAQKMGDNWTEKLFEQLYFKDVSFAVYTLLDNDSKQLFKKKEVTYVDDDGEEKTKTIGGVELLMENVSGAIDKESMLMALIENLGLSRPIIDEITEAEAKKKGK